MKLGTETGSLVNRALASCQQIVPVAGMGATACGWTDRHAGTIIEVINDKKLKWRRDHAQRLGKIEKSDVQNYEYSPNPDAAELVFTKTVKSGWKNRIGQRLVIGIRDEYFDYSF